MVGALQFKARVDEFMLRVWGLEVTSLRVCLDAETLNPLRQGILMSSKGIAVASINLRPAF